MKVVRVTGAAKIVDVDRRTVYNYVKRNKVFAVKVADGPLIGVYMAATFFGRKQTAGLLKSRFTITVVHPKCHE